MDSLFEHAADVESLAVLSRFRLDLRACLAARGYELSGLADAVLCARAVRTLASLWLVSEHRRGIGPQRRLPATAGQRGRVRQGRVGRGNRRGIGH